MAREIESAQWEIGQTAIGQIQFDLKSRDDIPKILRGLQYLYVTDTIREPIFKLLEEKVLPDVDKENGRPGMSLWKMWLKRMFIIRRILIYYMMRYVKSFN